MAIKQLTIEQLQLLNWLEGIFSKGITKEWLFLLANAEIHRYEKGVVAIHYEDDVCVIHSGTKNNQPLTVGMYRIIRRVLKNNKKVAIQSSLPEKVAHLAKKLNLRYNTRYSFYYQGDIIWQQQQQ